MDLRLDISFFRHRKTLRLIRTLGKGAVYDLIQLWGVAAEQDAATGQLHGWEVADIEAAVSWTGEPGQLVAELVAVGFLDHLDGGGFVPHHWEHWQQYLAKSPERTEKARRNAQKRWTQQGEQVETGCEQHASSMPVACKVYAPSLSLPSLTIPSQDIARSDSAAIPPEPPSSPAVAMIPLVGGKEYPVTEDQADEWAEAYPRVDILQALRQIRQWNQSNPTKRKTARGVVRHITAWLAQIQNTGKGPLRSESQPAYYTPPPKPPPTPVEDLPEDQRLIPPEQMKKNWADLLERMNGKKPQRPVEEM